MGAVNADVWRRLTWVEPSWFENDWGADQRQQGDPKHTISREELGFEGQPVRYCGLMSARQILNASRNGNGSRRAGTAKAPR